jgi:phage shock protein E
MLNIKFMLVAIASIFILTQCNSQTQKTKTMETTTKSDTLTKQIIVDVRTPEEWEMDGHAECSVNYPLDEFDDKIEELKSYDKVIIVCRSGNRAGVAKARLLNAGYKKEIENLGPWQNVSCKN